MGLHGGRGGPEPAAGDHELTGVYYAKVTKNQDEANVARVKLTFPWLPESDVDQSFWAPICVPMIGPEFGTYTLPEVGDTVAVVFIAGDIRYPVVVGGIWSDPDQPPTDKVDHRLIRSRSGHDLLLDDEAKSITLKSKSGDEVAACGSGVANSGDGASFVSKSGALDIMCPSGTLKFDGNEVSIAADTAVSIKSGGDLEVAGTSKAAFNASGVGKYEGSSTKLG